MPGYGPVASYPICGPDALSGPIIAAALGGAGIRERRPVRQIVTGRLEVIAAPAVIDLLGEHQGQIVGVLTVTAAGASIQLRGRSDDEEGWLMGEESERSMPDTEEALALWLLGFDE